MSELWMILDCPYLAHRAHASMEKLEYDGQPSSVLFGLMRDLAAWQITFSASRFVFCFDSRESKRKAIYQRYKENRKPREDETKEEKEGRRLYYEQVNRLMNEDLYRLGFRNVLWAEGYEADDAIASVCLFSIPKKDQAVIVSSDHDLWQLISPLVSVYDPRGGRRRTLQWFSRTWGLSPCQWADVKALAGCSSDNVRGVDGIGEKTAAAFLAGKLKTDSKRHEVVVAGNERWRRNLRLVRLPFEGCPKWELREDKLTRKRWRRECERWGMRSLQGLYLGR